MNTAVKLSTYGLMLAVAFAGSWSVGTLVGRAGGSDSAPHARHDSTAPAPAPVPPADQDGKPRPTSDAAAPHRVDRTPRTAARDAAGPGHRESTGTSPETAASARPSRDPGTVSSSAGATRSPTNEDSEPRQHRSRTHQRTESAPPRHAAEHAGHKRQHPRDDQHQDRRSRR